MIKTFRDSLSLLATRRFGTFWFASLLSSIGTWAQQVAQPWLLLTLGASSFLIGLDSFARNAPVSIFPRAMGLEPYLVIKGLAVRLMPSLPVESAEVVRVGPASVINVPRSLALWRDTFKGRQAFEKQNEWIDASSLVMPAQYVIAGSALSEALRKRGSAAE